MLNIRKATDSDIAFLVNVNLLANEQRLSVNPEWNAETFCKKAQTSTTKQIQGKVKNSVTYVIEFHGAAVGRLRVIRPSHEIHIAGIQILPNHQHKGIGSSVITEIIKESKEKALQLTLEVEKDNPNAKRLYERMGFIVAEDRNDRELMTLRTSTQTLQALRS